MLAAERRRSWPLAALCGALIGAAISIKFTLGVFALLPLAALAVARGERLGLRLARAAGYLLGCAAVVGAIVVLVWRARALGDMLAIMFAWNAQYAAIRASGLDTIVFQTWRFWFGHDHGVLNLIGVLALAGLADLILRREKDPTRWMPAAWAAVMLAQVYVQGKYFEYHWLPALPPFCLLAGMGVAAVWGRLRERVEPLSTAKWAAGGAWRCCCWGSPRGIGVSSTRRSAR